MQELGLFNNRLKDLRRKMRKSQAEFGVEIAELLGRPAPFSVSAVSAWESGRKKPSLSTMSVIADYFQVNLEYLRGKSNNPNENAPIKYDYLELKSRIEKENIEAYDNTPVWLEFELPKYSNQWGIVSMKKNCIVCSDMNVSLNASGYNVYVIPLPNDIFTEAFFIQPLSWREVLAAKEPFWVEIQTKDEKIKYQYTGWGM